MKKGPLPRYQTLVRDGDLRADPRQLEAVNHLQQVYLAVRNYQPDQKSFFGKRPARPKGLYLWGGVGRGKSLLMDVFFNNVPMKKKRRVHFHQFMIETHQRIADWRNMDEQSRKAHPHFQRRAEIDDPLPHVAAQIFAEAHLLCFDELQVTDVTDAMIIGRLFGRLFDLGCVVVSTSNRIPDHLYKDGINREVFLPAIDRLKAEMVIFHLDSEHDYRRGQLTSAPVYYAPLNEETRKALDQAWQAFIAGGTEEPQTFLVKGRTLTITRTARGAARVSFAQMCEQTLGAEDYLTVAENYHTVFMENIPILTPEMRNEAKRFVTFIDALYERRVKLVCSAEAEPDALYPRGTGAFEFNRTASRLLEMGSDAYLKTPIGGEDQEKDALKSH